MKRLLLVLLACGILVLGCTIGREIGCLLIVIALAIMSWWSLTG